MYTCTMISDDLIFLINVFDIEFSEHRNVV